MATVTEWFDSVYGDPLYLDLYEEDDLAVAAAEVHGALRLLDPAPGVRWLEACCGFGRHAGHLAQAGFEVVGLDRSPLMLRRARELFAGSSAAPRYVLGDLRRLPFAGGFDCASILFDSFGFFASDEEHLDALLSLASALNTHGRLVIHLSNREHLLATLPATETEVRHGCRIHKAHRIDLPQGRLASTLHVEGPHGTRRWDFDRRLFAASELRELCCRAGFDRLDFRGGWDGSPLGPNSPSLILLARKAAFSDLPDLPA